MPVVPVEGQGPAEEAGQLRLRRKLPRTAKEADELWI
eukprot:CAMPEP_0115062978 /NCGR_PEP_ID=MMETSP0227-20121206/8851_1 /TAXON_ID=89957 /ORGANISM="Polarella glacialis, Strain CCMP 1383" /LENGTH=36 /DNA_ID= /DNA_START= /DNA_END= /DNA_ORIENTATION=